MTWSCGWDIIQRSAIIIRFYCYLSVHSKIAEVFANPSKQKNPCS